MDAEYLNIINREYVKVVSSVGSIRIEAEITDSIMKGVVSIPHGDGHHRNGTELKVASENPGVSINDLTDGTRIDALCGNAVFL